MSYLQLEKATNLLLVKHPIAASKKHPSEFMGLLGFFGFHSGTSSKHLFTSVTSVEPAGHVTVPLVPNLNTPEVRTFKCM